MLRYPVIMTLNRWNWAGIVGLLRTLQEFLLPDPIPDALNKLITPGSAHFTGFVPFVSVVLLLWVSWGIISFLIGIVGSFVVLNRS